jgi:hypothetical protein
VFLVSLAALATAAVAASCSDGDSEPDRITRIDGPAVVEDDGGAGVVSDDGAAE